MSNTGAYCKLIETDFDNLDRHHSGYLEVKDIENNLKLHGFSSQHAKEFVKEFDANKDGKISKDEYSNALKKVKRSTVTESQLRSLFKKADKDNSGKITKEELWKYLKDQNNIVPQEDVCKWIQRFDKNMDKQLNYEEFINLIRHLI